MSGEELQVQYSMTILVLSDSHTECQSLALLDASPSGKPFNSRATGCVNSMLGGLAVKNRGAMAEQIDNLLVNAVHWQTLSAQTSKAANNLYHPSIITNKLSEILEGSP